MIDQELSEYHTKETELIDDISVGKLSEEDVKLRLKELWKTIPINIELNPVFLMNYITEKFPNIDLGTKTYTINTDTVISTILDKNKIIDQIRTRILDEHKKHIKFDWAGYAAVKIYYSFVDPNHDKTNIGKDILSMMDKYTSYIDTPNSTGFTKEDLKKAYNAGCPISWTDGGVIMEDDNFDDYFNKNYNKK